MYRVAILASCAVIVACSPAQAAEAVTVYTVQRGDTLYALAAAYLLRVDDFRAVQRANRIADPRRMRAGSQLKVPTRLLRTVGVNARLGAYSGPVTVTVSGRTLPLAAGMPLGEDVRVETGANAFARIDMPDGSRLAVPSQSRIRIERLRRILLTNAVERAFLVEAGRGESVVTPLRGPLESYIVRTPMSVSAVRGTEFNVHYEPEQRRAATEVFAGLVAVSAPGAETAQVPVGYGVSTAGSGLGPLTELLPAPSLLHPGSPFDGPSLGIDIAPLPGASGYRVRLAADAGFLDMLDETTTVEPRTAFDDREDGSYFVKISAIDPGGLEGRPATYAIDRRRNTLSLNRPVEAMAGGSRRYLFRWEVSGDGDRSYRFQLHRAGGVRPVIDQVGLADPQITVTDLPRGDYVWRVMSRTISGGRLAEKWSQAEPFHLGD